MFSQCCCRWRLRCSGMWQCVVGWILPTSLKDHLTLNWKHCDPLQHRKPNHLPNTTMSHPRKALSSQLNYLRLLWWQSLGSQSCACHYISRVTHHCPLPYIGPEGSLPASWIQTIRPTDGRRQWLRHNNSNHRPINYKNTCYTLAKGAATSS